MRAHSGGFTEPVTTGGAQVTRTSTRTSNCAVIDRRLAADAVGQSVPSRVAFGRAIADGLASHTRGRGAALARTLMLRPSHALLVILKVHPGSEAERMGLLGHRALSKTVGRAYVLNKAADVAGSLT
jgi:hypothetical protein